MLFRSGFTLLACILFWFYNAPLIRYGYCYILLFPAFIVGIYYIMTQEKIEKYFNGKVSQGIFVSVTCIILIVLGYKILRLGIDIKSYWNRPYFVWQQDYENHPVKVITKEGYKVYIPVEGDRTGYQEFPAIPYDTDAILRGRTIKNGFREKKENAK